MLCFLETKLEQWKEIWTELEFEASASLWLTSTVVSRHTGQSR